MEHDGYHLNQTGRQLHAAAILQAIDEIRQENQNQTTQNRQEQNDQETIEIIKTKASLVGHIIGKTRTYQETNRRPTPNQNKDNQPRRNRRIHHHHQRKSTENQRSQTTHNTDPTKQRNININETTATPKRPPHQLQILQTGYMQIWRELQIQPLKNQPRKPPNRPQQKP